MLDPSWTYTRPLLWLAVAAVLVALVLRAIRKDRRDYQRFKRLEATGPRQAMYRKWLRSSFVEFGGLALLLLIVAGAYLPPLAAELAAWPGVRELRDLIASEPLLVTAVLAGLALGLVGITAVAARVARNEQAVLTVGDIRALLPRNRQELVLGGLLSVNAGVVEEALFRLALPAVIFGASGSATAAVAGSVLLFGALHLYQGVVGIVGTTVIGAIMMLLFAVSGSIAVPMALHAIIDLRSLVIIPAAVYGAHRVDGRSHPFTLAPKAPAVVDDP